MIDALLFLLFFTLFYFGIGTAAVLYIVAVLKQREPYEYVKMPSSFERAVLTWPYRVILCFDAWQPKQDEPDEVKDLKKNPLE